MVLEGSQSERWLGQLLMLCTGNIKWKLKYKWLKEKTHQRTIQKLMSKKPAEPQLCPQLADSTQLAFCYQGCNVKTCECTNERGQIAFPTKTIMLKPYDTCVHGVGKGYPAVRISFTNPTNTCVILIKHHFTGNHTLTGYIFLCWVISEKAF